MAAQTILKSHSLKEAAQAAFQEWVSACINCARACTVCADACLAENQASELRRCIRLSLDCADICAATGRILARQTERDSSLLIAQVESCSIACSACAIECEKHRDAHQHCRICAEACRACEESCRKLLQSAFQK